MILPYRKENAEQVFKWQTEEVYCRFFRNFSRYLTIEECENLPSVMNAEVLGYYKEDGGKLDLIGLISSTHFHHGISELGGMVDQRHHGDGHGLKMMREGEAYFKKCGARKFICQLAIDDIHTIRLTESNGYTKDCVLKKHTMLNGDYMDVIQYHKFAGG